MAFKQENLAKWWKILLKKRKSNKKDKNVVCFPVISSQKFGFSGICRQICRY
jgi:hypothetical protein